MERYILPLGLEVLEEDVGMSRAMGDDCGDEDYGSSTRDTVIKG